MKIFDCIVLACTSKFIRHTKNHHDVSLYLVILNIETKIYKHYPMNFTIGGKRSTEKRETREKRGEKFLQGIYFICSWKKP